MLQKLEYLLSYKNCNLQFVFEILLLLINVSIFIVKLTLDVNRYKVFWTHFPWPFIHQLKFLNFQGKKIIQCVQTQPTITFFMLAIETLEKGVKCVQS